MGDQALGSRTVPSHGWQRHPLTQLLATFAALAPVYALSILSGLDTLITGEMQVPGVWASIMGIIVHVSIFGSWILVLLYYICGSRLSELQRRQGDFITDVVHGIVYAFAILLAMGVLHAIAMPQGTVEIPVANRAIAEALAGDNALFAVWVGPMMWLQAALLEELYRVFSLSRLWIVWPSPAGKVLVIVGYSLLFGLGHVYEGPVGMAGTAMISILLSYYYMQNRRILPMIIAHGIYNTVVLCGLVLFAKNGLL